jgi:hypothetical protein
VNIYDLLGREVATLVDGLLAAGEYRAAFDAAALASGVYLCTLRVGDFQYVKKMIMVR